jgi:hypothetical protein
MTWAKKKHQQPYDATEKGRARYLRYNKSPKGRERKLAYQPSPKGKLAKQKYIASPKGIEADQRRNAVKRKRRKLRHGTAKED